MPVPIDIAVTIISMQMIRRSDESPEVTDPALWRSRSAAELSFWGKGEEVKKGREGRKRRPPVEVIISYRVDGHATIQSHMETAPAYCC